MTKKCIMCNEIANSAEHIFPAALGGRRTNKKIYCHHHNQCFGVFVANLNKQLSFFNSLLDVRPDRKKTRDPSIQQGVDGNRYAVKGENILKKPKPLAEIADFEVGKEITIECSSQKEFEEWKAQQELNGFKIETTKIVPPTLKLHTSSIQLTLQFDDDLLHAISYLALTNFAHYLPTLTEKIDYTILKEKLLNPEKSVPACEWDGREYEDVSNKSPYEFGHTFILCISSEEKLAKAWVSVFSIFNFIVDIGNINASDDTIIRIDINPLAESARDDLIITKLAEPINKYTHSLIGNKEAVINGSYNKRIPLLIEKIQNYNIKKSIELLLNEILQRENKDELLSKFISDQTQVIFYILKKADKIFFEKIIPQINEKVNFKNSTKKTFIEEDTKLELGLSKETLNLLTELKEIVFNDIKKIINDDNENKLQRILSYLTMSEETPLKKAMKLISDEWFEIIKNM